MFLLLCLVWCSLAQMQCTAGEAEYQELPSYSEVFGLSFSENVLRDSDTGVHSSTFRGALRQLHDAPPGENSPDDNSPGVEGPGDGSSGDPQPGDDTDGEGTPVIVDPGDGGCADNFVSTCSKQPGGGENTQCCETCTECIDGDIVETEAECSPFSSGEECGAGALQQHLVPFSLFSGVKNSSRIFATYCVAQLLSRGSVCIFFHVVPDGFIET